MARARQSKYITLSNICELCTKPTKFALLGEASPEEEGKRWAKCSKCHHTVMIDMRALENERRTVKQLNVAMEDCIQYSPKSVYAIGDAIYHKAFDDMGMVISKELTSNGSQAIVVAFNKVGEKRLIENVA